MIIFSSFSAAQLPHPRVVSSIHFTYYIFCIRIVHARLISNLSLIGIAEDNYQVCPLCGIELENPENPDALEEHVAGHWCPSDTV